MKISWPGVIAVVGFWLWMGIVLLWPWYLFVTIGVLAAAGVSFVVYHLTAGTP